MRTLSSNATGERTGRHNSPAGSPPIWRYTPRDMEPSAPRTRDSLLNRLVFVEARPSGRQIKSTETDAIVTVYTARPGRSYPPQTRCGIAEAPLRRPVAQLVGEVQQEGHVKVALGLLDFRTRENDEAFAVRVQIENPDKIRQ